MKTARIAANLQSTLLPYDRPMIFVGMHLGSLAEALREDGFHQRADDCDRAQAILRDLRRMAMLPPLSRKRLDAMMPVGSFRETMHAEEPQFAEVMAVCLTLSALVSRGQAARHLEHVAMVIDREMRLCGVWPKHPTTVPTTRGDA